MGKQTDHDSGLARQFFGRLIRQRLNGRRRARRQRELQALNRPRAALIVGAGSPNGIGGAVAQRAAEGGLHVFVAGRNVEKIAATAAHIGNSATAVVVDARSTESIQKVFEQIASDGYALDLVVHNVGTNRPKPFLDITPEKLESAWLQDTASGFEVARQALAAMVEQGHGTLLFTGASASLRGKAGFALFAQAKAGLRMLAQSLAREFGPQGIHVAHVVIDGAVDGDRLRDSVPGYLDAQGEDGALSPTAIAETYWQLHQQHRSVWTHELDLRPFKENW
ncbi:SDR family NAD(P)-dependent oxidoreductase [Marinobacter sp. SS21]|uniref:SDR family NAD(P)-dependent oxidoreductase n=1 Tax=Marinobacter sp. SS21 TaxID=2979460 RepID=UPI00232BFA88|nr:SDR family NAD(P)-dependent oxidoreductase [Marinobacter sp. SS21]MDC0663683.1 SDR family NAD(P)-dependent oxidoreductase [Marinobacter sp. SS21]